MTSLSAATSVLAGSESGARVMAAMMLTSTAHRSTALAVARLVSPSTVLHSDLDSSQLVARCKECHECSIYAT